MERRGTGGHRGGHNPPGCARPGAPWCIVPTMVRFLEVSLFLKFLNIQTLRKIFLRFFRSTFTYHITNVTPSIQSYTNHTRKCVRSRSRTHGKISQHNSRHKLKIIQGLYYKPGASRARIQNLKIKRVSGTNNI